jgi:hypothetical protein
VSDIAWLGVDVGWVFPAADSDGNIYEWTHYKHPKEPLTEAGPVTIRKPDGHVVKRAAYTDEEVAIMDARYSPLVVRGLAKRIVTAAKRTDRGLALEDWSSFEARKKAWTRVYSCISDNAAARDVPVTQVNRAYTSITCPRCDHKGRENRPTRDTFACARCGFSGHADVIAAMNIARKAEGTFRADMGRCANENHDEGLPAWKASLCVFCYRFRRHYGRVPTAEDLDLRAQSPTMEKYRQQMRQQAEEESRQRRDAATDARTRKAWKEWDAAHPWEPFGDVVATRQDRSEEA